MGILRFKAVLVASLTCVLLYSCQNQSSLLARRESLRDSLLSFYKDNKDSIQRESVNFLIDNMDETQTVTFPLFREKRTRKLVALNMLQIANKRQFDSLIKVKNIVYYDTTVCDAMFVTSAYLRKQIDKAFSDWRTYPWNKNVSKEMFLNYLLPYKVAIDKPTDWRLLLSNFYSLDLAHLNSPYWKKSSPDSIVSQFPALNEEIHDPLLVFKDAPEKISQSDNFELLMLTKQGDCIGFSLMNVYRLRALGIPATIDFIPLWGKMNARHCEAIYLGSKEPLKPLQMLQHDERRPTKALRYTFKIQKAWSDTIEPTVNYPKNFQLKNLMNNHWIDVTAEYNQVADVTYRLNKIYPEKYAYICAFNYGQWLPIFWGAKTGNKVVFKNMGTDVVYRIAVPIGQYIKFVSNPFLLTRDKQLKFYHDDGSRYDRIKLNKTNTGSESRLVGGHTYTLSYWNVAGYWTVLTTIQARTKKLDMNDPLVKMTIKTSTDKYKQEGLALKPKEIVNSLRKTKILERIISSGVVYKNAPKNVFYKLESTDDKKHLARIFLIDSITHKQLWY